MNRSRSPLSDRTIQRLVNDNDSDSDLSINDNCDSASSEPLFGDDTDSDPDYNPENDIGRPGPSNNLGLANTQHHVSNSDSSDDDARPIQIRGRPRGRPRRPSMANSDDGNSSGNDSEDGTGWVNVEEGNDVGHNHNFAFSELPGVKHCPPPNSSPAEYFKLFFTTALLDIFVKYTNMYAEQFIANNIHTLPDKSRTKQWKPVTRQEMLAFILVMVNMGLNPKPTIYMYWTKISSQFSPWFARMFSRNRFQAILKFFHMVDTSNIPRSRQPGYDPCARFQCLIDHANRVSKHHFVPNQNLSVDESMVSTKTHSQLLQYLPKKRHRWGVKLWSLCDSATSYCISFFVYKGANNDEDKREIKKMA